MKTDMLVWILLGLMYSGVSGYMYRRSYNTPLRNPFGGGGGNNEEHLSFHLGPVDFPNGGSYSFRLSNAGEGGPNQEGYGGGNSGYGGSGGGYGGYMYGGPFFNPYYYNPYYNNRGYGYNPFYNNYYPETSGGTPPTLPTPPTPPTLPTGPTPPSSPTPPPTPTTPTAPPTPTTPTAPPTPTTPTAPPTPTTPTIPTPPTPPTLPTIPTLGTGTPFIRSGPGYFMLRNNFPFPNGNFLERINIHGPGPVEKMLMQMLMPGGSTPAGSTGGSTST